jgi:hypothetical protein
MTVLSKNAVHFSQSRLPGSHVSQPECNGDRIELVLAERQRQPVRRDQPFDSPLASYNEHRQAEVGANKTSVGILSEDLKSKSPAASCQIQNVCRPPGGDLAPDATPPKRVHS